MKLIICSVLLLFLHTWILTISTTCNPGTCLYRYCTGCIISCPTCSAGTYTNGQDINCDSACSESDTDGDLFYCNCAPCPEGTYQPNTGASSCDLCPTGKYSTSTGASSSSSCLDCPMGTYTDSTGSTQCKSCPTGTYSNSTGLTSVDECTQCAAGKYSTQLGADSSSTCEICPEGTYSTAGSSSCTDCPIGTYCEYGDCGNECVDCPAGTYNFQEGQNICVECPTGTYSTAIGATSENTCTDCPEGTYNDKTGSGSESACLQCLPGTYSGPGTTTCLDCPEGSISTTAASSCQSYCSPGSGVYAGSSSSSTSLNVCGYCNPGYYNPGGSIYCSTCPTGEQSSANATSCSATCPSGTGVNSGSSSSSTSPNVCGPCSVGYYNTGSSVYCSTCDSGETSTTGASSCYVIPNVNSSPEDSIFSGNNVYYAFPITFGIGLIISAYLVYRRSTIKGIATISFLNVAVNIVLSCMITCTSILLVMALLENQNNLLAFIIILARVVNAVAAVAILGTVLYGENNLLSDLLQHDWLVRDIFSIVFLVMLIDVKAIAFLPWKHSEITTKYNGIPKASVLYRCLLVNIMNSSISFCGTIATLIFANVSLGEGIGNLICNLLLLSLSIFILNMFFLSEKSIPKKENMRESLIEVGTTRSSMESSATTVATAKIV